MKKSIYISPSAFVCEITGKPVLSTTSIVIDKDDKISDENNIGFVREQKPQIDDNNLWDDEW